MKELVMKLMAYGIVLLFVSLLRLDRYQFLALLGIGIIIVQNVFIRWSLLALERNAEQIQSQLATPATK